MHSNIIVYHWSHIAGHFSLYLDKKWSGYMRLEYHMSYKIAVLSIDNLHNVYAIIL